MTKNEAYEIITAETIGYFSGFGGLEIKAIEYGVSDVVKFVVGAWTGDKKACSAVVWYDDDGAYFTYRRNKIYFSDCVRC